MLVDGVALIGAFLAEEHFKSDIHPTRDGYQGSGASVDAKASEGIAFVAVDLGGVAAYKHLAFDDLGMEQSRSGTGEGQQKGKYSESFHFRFVWVDNLIVSLLLRNSMQNYKFIFN